MEVKIYSPKEYCEKLEKKGLTPSVKTVIRRCEKNLLPSDTQAKKVGRTWIIIIFS